MAKLMVTSRLRQVVVAILLVGLSTTGVTPRLLAAASCRPGQPTTEAAKICCCDGACGGRCGMSCCQPAAPQPDPLSTPPKPSQEVGPLVGLAVASFAQIDPAAAAEFRHGHFCDDLCGSAGPSLLALSIRLNL